MVTSVTDNGDGNCCGRSGAVIIFSRIAVGGSLSLCNAAFALLPPSAATPRSGAEDSHVRDRPGAAGASGDERGSSEEDLWSDPVM